MDVAQLEVAHFVHHLLVIDNLRINTLAVPVAWYILTGCSLRDSGNRGRRRGDQLRGGSSGGGPTRGFGIHCRGVAWRRTRIGGASDGLVRRLVNALIKRKPHSIRSCPDWLACRRLRSRVLRQIIDIYFVGAKQVLELDTRILALEELELFFERYTLKERDAVGEGWLCILLKQPCVPVVV